VLDLSHSCTTDNSILDSVYILAKSSFQAIIEKIQKSFKLCTPKNSEGEPVE